MSCNCNFYQRKLEKVQRKYSTLRRNHRKLLGVTLLLTEALDGFVKGRVKNNINDILLTCSAIYPDLFKNEGLKNEKSDDLQTNLDDLPSVEVMNENGPVFDTATESEKEYYEGFMARPKIPRTPQV